jgi:hypothetical protein
MAQVWLADSSVQRDDPAGATFRGLRAFEQSWRRLEVAATRGDALELAAASASAARACLTDGDLDEAQWHLQRGGRFLSLHDTCPRGLTLQCEMAEVTLRLAHCLADDDEHAARRLRDDTRDTLFEVVRRAQAARHQGALTSALLHVADILTALGDHSDAETVRTQALQGMGGASLRN